ncbi:hypothetical protein L1987_17406 [Smallanthus sonchifolius]|uniref:Uncharacterized protein n=1 Tax=Smallanthus sonchifolius TaxID=185202 RepID=A0ACB9IWP8_9ASTR|nr:hypothetical protein L1987_17406 [Smallanthus sonchifolius]
MESKQGHLNLRSDFMEVALSIQSYIKACGLLHTPQSKHKTKPNYNFIFTLSSCILHPSMARNSKNTTDRLAKIGKETFDAIDDIFPRGHQSSKQQVFQYHQYQPQQTYVVQQQVYDAPVAAMRTERVINCDEAAKKFGGTLFVEYHKRKPAHKGFFF